MDDGPAIEPLAKRLIRDIEDYPKKGITFRDITPLLKDPKTFSLCIEELASKLKERKIDYIVGIESRGFIVGAPLAQLLGVGFIPVRKKGKLPFRTVSKSYELEYGTATIELHADSIERGKRVAIVDDLLATGGTTRATIELVRELGGIVDSCAFLIELTGLSGREKLEAEVFSLIKY
jgi:adenine phosphoribosyltransferase